MTALTIVIDNPFTFVACAVAGYVTASFLLGLVGNWLEGRNPNNHWRTAYMRETDRRIQALSDGRCPTCGTPYAEMPDPDPTERLDTP